MMVSLVIPAYNEEKRLPFILEAAVNYFKGAKFDYEIIVVDDGSKDNTLAVIDKYRAVLPQMQVIKSEGNRGKGAAVKKGMLAAKGDFCVFADADNSTPLEELEKFLLYFNNGYDVVVGSRGMKESEIAISQPWYKMMLGKLGNQLIQHLLGLKIQDTQCGFKGFSRKATEMIFKCQTVSGWAFDVEILLLAKKFGLEIKEIPVCWLNSPDSKVAWPDYFLVLKEIFKIKIDQQLKK